MSGDIVCATTQFLGVTGFGGSGCICIALVCGIALDGKVVIYLACVHTLFSFVPRLCEINYERYSLPQLLHVI